MSPLDERTGMTQDERDRLIQLEVEMRHAAAARAETKEQITQILDDVRVIRDRMVGNKAVWGAFSGLVILAGAFGAFLDRVISWATSTH